MLTETRYFLHFVFLLDNFYLKNGSTISTLKFSMILYGTHKGNPQLV